MKERARMVKSKIMKKDRKRGRYSKINIRKRKEERERNAVGRREGMGREKGESREKEPQLRKATEIEGKTLGLQIIAAESKLFPKQVT